MQHLQKTGGWGVLLLTSPLCFPTFKRACKGPLFSIASTLFHFPYPVTPLLATLTKTAGCVPTIPILEHRPGRLPRSKSAPLHLPPVTSHDSPVTSRPIPLSQTEQASAPSLMHIITAASSLPLGPGDRSFPRLGGRHEGQAPHHPYCRRRFDRPGSHRAVLDSRQPVPSHHRRKSFRRARPQVQLGNMSLSLLSGSLSAENLSIGDDPKFSSSPFLTAKSLKVGVEMIPLIFSKTLNVTGVTIDSPQVTLLHNAAGLWNYSSLGAKSQVGQTPAPKPVGSTSAPADLTIKKLELKNGSIILGSTNSQKRSTYDHVDVAASDVSIISKFPITVTADLPSGGKFKLDGTVGPIDQADTSVTPLSAKLHISSLNLASTGFLDPSLGLGGLLDLDGTLESKGGEAKT